MLAGLEAIVATHQAAADPPKPWKRARHALRLNGSLLKASALKEPLAPILDTAEVEVEAEYEPVSMSATPRRNILEEFSASQRLEDAADSPHEALVKEQVRNVHHTGVARRSVAR